ncbi:MAG: hypothetical protein ABIM59_04970 [candidate division WOR-3 bacterium]
MNVIDLLVRRQSRKEQLRSVLKVDLYGLEKIFGLNVGDGDLVVIFGQPKAGKTTVALNWAWRIAKGGYPVTVAATESVMTAERYALMLLALEATDILFSNEYYGDSLSASILDTILLSDDPAAFCKSRGKPHVWEAIELAISNMSQYSVDIYGASLEDGGMVNAENLFSLMRRLESPCVFVLDQVSQVSLPGDLDPAPSAIKVMKELARIIKENKLAAIVLSQVSTISSREGKDAPLGGNLIVAEANLGVKPLRNGDELVLTSPPLFSRSTPPFSVVYRIDPISGLMLGYTIAGQAGGKSEYGI